ncbi:hypothetical protein F5Y18DRAFT_442058 [Xylariaceae sp. FL1019]|nr:hypothetical protein F5Y18DRAFT_442058 [Xylariaceae sp. FL1019]
MAGPATETRRRGPPTLIQGLITAWMSLAIPNVGPLRFSRQAPLGMKERVAGDSRTTYWEIGAGLSLQATAIPGVHWPTESLAELQVFRISQPTTKIGDSPMASKVPFVLSADVSTSSVLSALCSGGISTCCIHKMNDSKKNSFRPNTIVLGHAHGNRHSDTE